MIKFPFLIFVLNKVHVLLLIGGAFKAAELDAKEAINQAVRLAATI